MTTTTSSGLAAIRARLMPALGDRLPAHIARLDWRPEELAESQRTSLRSLLHHAAGHSPFHAARLAAAGLVRADIDTFELSDLAQIPVMTKAQMMVNFDDVVTDRRVTRALVERHITESATEPPLILGDYICLASGGSSGLRGIYVQTPEEYYELTDRFTPAGVSAAGFLRATVDGRADEGFRYGDLTMHPSVLTTALLQTPAVREYQIRQTSRGVTVVVVADTDFDHSRLAAGIERSLRQAGLTKPEVSISCVEAITRDPLNGKAKRFVPNSAAAARPSGTGQPT